MKNCPVCNAPLNDNDVFCTNCGAPQQPESPPAGNTYQNNPNNPYPNNQNNQQQTPPPNYNQPYQPAYNPYDHTSEYDAKDISANKVIAMATYLLGWLGIIIALLAAKESPYASFHVRQAMKMQITTILLGICALILFFTIIVPIAAGVCMVIVFVLQIIAFFQVCSGKAKEPAIIRSFGFFK